LQARQREHAQHLLQEQQHCLLKKSACGEERTTTEIQTETENNQIDKITNLEWLYLVYFKSDNNLNLRLSNKSSNSWLGNIKYKI
jgi:hypothetical protein